MSSQYTNLPLRYVPDPIATAASEDPYWLTIEQVVEDDKATVADAAEVIDELYDLEACVDVETAGAEEDPAEAEPPTKDKLLEIAADKFDLAECKRRMSGTYETELKIARSHQDEPYKLILSIGKILKTEKIEEEVPLTIPVEKVASLVLPQPVLSGLAVSWLGPVYSTAGTVPLPEISAKHNTLSWPGLFTGTIKAEYTTVYDLVTVEIPGVPKYPGSPLGDPQDSRALAFYHFSAYPADISPPPEDSSADAATLAEVCGWTDDLDQPDEPDPLPEPLPPPEYGCIDYSLRLADPYYYAEKCCEPKTPDGCRTRTEANPGGHTLPQEIIDKLTLEHEGPIEFIAVGPEGVDGCGKIYYEQIVRPQNCCEDATPILWDSANSVEVLADNTAGWVFVTGGVKPYRWKIRGQGMTFDGHTLRDAVTDAPCILVYAGPSACGHCPIEVTDGCSIVRGGVRSTDGNWYLMGTYFIGSGEITSWLEKYGQPVVTSNVYLGLSNGPEVSRFSADGRYFVGRNGLTPGQTGVLFQYVGANVTYGVIAGCLDGFAPADPFCGKFNVVLAQGCSEYNGAVYSLTISQGIAVWEWRC